MQAMIGVVAELGFTIIDYQVITGHCCSFQPSQEEETLVNFAAD